MKEITVFIDKVQVFDEVAKTTAYEGVKNDAGDGKVYDKVFSTEAEQEMLERFWRESCTDITLILQRFTCLSCDGSCDTGFSARLQMDETFDMGVQPFINQTLHSLAVEIVTGKWLSLMPNAENGAVSNLQAQHSVNTQKTTETLQRLLRVRKGKIRRKLSTF